MKILVIQTAFIGDVILATALLEKLHRRLPHARIDVVVRKGNEALFSGHPYVQKVHVWNKKQDKTLNLLKLGIRLRRERYDWVINLQRFFSTGLLTLMSLAPNRAGFYKNPLSGWFTHPAPHRIGTPEAPVHEVERNCLLADPLAGPGVFRPRLYPTQEHFAKAKREKPYVCIAPTSVWHTKQWPAEKWIRLINKLPLDWQVILLGGPADLNACEHIRQASTHPDVENAAGKYDLLGSAALMKGAQVNYVNDSAPMHLASAVNAPVVAIYCSTVPWFGFGPLSEKSAIAETTEALSCRPCGLHGKRHCPEGHFRCADIEIESLLPEHIRWAPPDWKWFPNFSA